MLCFVYIGFAIAHMLPGIISLIARWACLYAHIADFFKTILRLTTQKIPVVVVYCTTSARTLVRPFNTPLMPVWRNAWSFGCAGARYEEQRGYCYWRYFVPNRIQYRISMCISTCERTFLHSVRGCQSRVWDGVRCVMCVMRHRLCADAFVGCWMAEWCWFHRGRDLPHEYDMLPWRVWCLNAGIILGLCCQHHHLVSSNMHSI